MASIGFDFGPFHAYVSDRGNYGIAARDLPWAVVGPLPGLLEHGRAETLNETWDDEGREPHRIIGTDEEMPDLEDPRLERCLRVYVQRHRQSLERRLAQARQRWDEMQRQTVLVKDVRLQPGQRVRLYCAGTPSPQEAVEVGEFVFHAIDEEGCIYLGGEGGFRSQKLGPLDRLEPVNAA